MDGSGAEATHHIKHGLRPHAPCWPDPKVSARPCFGSPGSPEHLGVPADTTVTPEETEPGPSSEQRSSRQQSAPLWGQHLKAQDDSKKERMVSRPLWFSARKNLPRFVVACWMRKSWGLCTDQHSGIASICEHQRSIEMGYMLCSGMVQSAAAVAGAATCSFAVTCHAPGETTGAMQMSERLQDMERALTAGTGMVDPEGSTTSKRSLSVSAARKPSLSIRRTLSSFRCELTCSAGRKRGPEISAYAWRCEEPAAVQRDLQIF